MARTINPNKPVILPWRVVIDTAEQSPWTFEGIKADAAKAGRPIVVETVRRCLGRHPNSYGDYTLETADGEHSFLGWVAIERKSMEDWQSTVLDFEDGRHGRFEAEIKNLARVNESGGAAVLILECNYDASIKSAPEYGKHTRTTNGKILHRSPIAMLMDYHMKWIPAGDRRLAEITAFRWMERYWRKYRSRVIGVGKPQTASFSVG